MYITPAGDEDVRVVMNKMLYQAQETRHFLGAYIVTRYFEEDSEDEAIPSFVKIKAGLRARVKRKPLRKTSYESSVEVQRWLSEQAIDDDDKPAFNPAFLASKRDAPWILSSLTPFYKQDLITDVLYAAKSGKEASVYCCVAHPSTGVKYLAAKVYRPRMFRSLKNDAIYRTGREQRDVDGQVVHSNRQYEVNKHNERVRASRVASWIEYEYLTQCLLYDIGANVPRPIAHIGNAVLMEYIGDVDESAPRLCEMIVEREEAQSLFDLVMRNVELCLAHDRIHGDLSEYNILYWQGAITLIDFAQSVDPRYNPNVFPLLVRDIERICRYFAHYGVVADKRSLAVELWERYMGPAYPM